MKTRINTPDAYAPMAGAEKVFTMAYERFASGSLSRDYALFKQHSRTTA